MSAKSDFVVPEYVDGKPTWVPFAQDIQRLIKEGSPTHGWEGDERLYVTPCDGEGYVVGRLNEDGTKSAIAFSEAPHKLDEGILLHLAAHDTRHVDVYARVEKKNAALHKDANDKAVARISEATERVVWGIKRDLGGLA